MRARRSTDARSKPEAVTRPSALPERGARSADRQSAEEAAAGANEAGGDERHRRIAERAYQLAKARGFAPGQELADWLAAEAQEERSAASARNR